MEHKIIIHGSENSLDRDAYVIIPSILDKNNAKKLCDSLTDINANLLVIENGQVIWSYKGTIDECNNSILATYHLHIQETENPIMQKMDRNYGLKMLRTIRGLLSYNSRTDLREIIKKALVSNSFDEKVSVLKQVNLNTILDFQKTSLIETYKFFAFQMGQTLALLEDNVELFTKNSVGAYYPELQDYLDRKSVTPEKLQLFFNRFLSFIENSYINVEKQNLICTNYHNIKQVLDCKKEIVLPPVVVFDIDGTLVDETHRKEYRDKKDWETYFNMCDLDTPIEHVIKLTQEYRQKGFEIWLMTGRSEICKEKTIASMQKYGVQYDKLKMRSKDVMIPDYVLKPAWISKYIGKERVEAIYDDRDQVIQGFEKKGLNVIDVKKLTPVITIKQKLN